eukprot:GFUD01138416.1.p1 GENE.GFUD01138416.1~~GFUD01138416.1.p1  ORF type:complete len:206 (-),score=59.57 GFUD01138416.1:163-780(-)
MSFFNSSSSPAETSVVSKLQSNLIQKVSRPDTGSDGGGTVSRLVGQETTSSPFEHPADISSMQLLLRIWSGLSSAVLLVQVASYPSYQLARLPASQLDNEEQAQASPQVQLHEQRPTLFIQPLPHSKNIVSYDQSSVLKEVKVKVNLDAKTTDDDSEDIADVLLIELINVLKEGLSELMPELREGGASRDGGQCWTAPQGHHQLQ